MKTEYLDLEISILKGHKKKGLLNSNGLKTLDEYLSIKSIIEKYDSLENIKSNYEKRLLNNLEYAHGLISEDEVDKFKNQDIVSDDNYSLIEIDFDGHVKAMIETIDPKLRILSAVDGRGNLLYYEDVIKRLIIKPKPVFSGKLPLKKKPVRSKNGNPKEESYNKTYTIDQSKKISQFEIEIEDRLSDEIESEQIKRELNAIKKYMYETEGFLEIIRKDRGQLSDFQKGRLSFVNKLKDIIS